MVKNVIPKHMEAISAKLLEMGCEVVEFDEAIRVVGKPRQNHMNFKTLPYPGFPTDMQPQMTVALALAEGTSVVTESIFENRFKYVDELARMGADIRVSGRTALVTGKPLHGARVRSTDLRGGAAMVVAALAARGESMIEELHHIDRGYERMEEKLTALGADIRRVEDS